MSAAAFLAVVAVALTSSTTPAEPAVGGAPFRPNILFVIADDMGVDRVGAYREHPDHGNTPNIDRLAARGVLFRNAWAYDTCTPSRAALLTGRHGHRTGLGTFIGSSVPQFELADDEVSLADVLGQVGYRTAVVGKWHLARGGPGQATHPLRLGFEHHRGPMSNLPNIKGPLAYQEFVKVVDGVPFVQTEYATTDQVDDALELIEQFGGEPWFVWLAFNAPHRPLHEPPPHLHTVDLDAPGPRGPKLMKAMAEAMDTELGRLLASMDPVVRANTYIVFLGDNGTNGPSVTPPFDPAKAKSSAYEGGINVPLIVSGPHVAAGRESGALVHVLDLFATVCQLTGADDSAGLDSKTLLPWIVDPDAPSPPVVFTERFRPNGFGPYDVREIAVRDERYKLVRRFVNGVASFERLHDLVADPFEDHDLLHPGPGAPPPSADDVAALAELRAEIDGF